MRLRGHECGCEKGEPTDLSALKAAKSRLEIKMYSYDG
jgi:hypothetical protein